MADARSCKVEATLAPLECGALKWYHTYDSTDGSSKNMHFFLCNVKRHHGGYMSYVFSFSLVPDA
jgi:hypothetical protein